MLKTELTILANGSLVGGKGKREMKERTPKSYGMYPKPPAASEDVWISVTPRA